MKKATREWVRKAEADYQLAATERAARVSGRAFELIALLDCLQEGEVRRERTCEPTPAALLFYPRQLEQSEQVVQAVGCAGELTQLQFHRMPLWSLMLSVA